MGHGFHSYVKFPEDHLWSFVSTYCIMTLIGSDFLATWIWICLGQQSICSRNLLSPNFLDFNRSQHVSTCSSRKNISLQKLLDWGGFRDYHQYLDGYNGITLNDSQHMEVFLNWGYPKSSRISRQLVLKAIVWGSPILGNLHIIQSHNSDREFLRGTWKMLPMDLAPVSSDR